MRNKKINDIISALYWIFLFLFFIGYLFYGVFAATLIIAFSKLLFYGCFIVIPICILILQLFFESKFKFYISILMSSIITILYVCIIVPIIQFGIKNYLSVFTIDKWQNIHQSHRYLMIDDLEKKYNFVGMTKEEVFEILGEEHINQSLVIEYYVGDGGRKSIYYNVYLNKNDEVIKSELETINYD
jgi:hypothetical protein